MLASALSTARGRSIILPRVVCCFLTITTPRTFGITATSKRQLYRLAIARELPDSFRDAVAEHQHTPDPTSTTATEPAPLCLERARQQHANYVAALRHILPVLALPPLENHPDCCFVEDGVVAIDNRAVITRMGHPSRRGEVDSIKTVLEQLGMDIVDMREKSNKATCDGGDVLFTGRHLFVGLSNRTNREGAQVLSNAFGHLDSIVVPPTMQGGDVLHLKSAVTHMDECTLVAPTGSAGDQVLEAMRAEQLGYHTIRLPDVLACNLVSCNGKLLVQDTKCSESRQTLKNAAKERHMEMIYVDSSELAKKDAALTCCSVLLMGH